MKISQIHSNIALSNIQHNNKTAEFQTVPNYLPKKSDISAENYRAYFLPRISFGKAQSPNYSNVKEFSTYLADKIQKDLLVKNEVDIENIINSVADKSKLDKNTVTEVLARLTQFSSYSQLPQKNFQLNHYLQGKVCLDNVMLYLQKKNQIPDQTNIHSKYDFLLDDYALDRADNLYSLKRDVKKHKTKLIVLDGYSAKVDGKPCCYNLFSNAENLEDVTLAVCNRIKSEEISVDEALNGDIIKRAKKVFGKFTNVEILKNPNAENPTAKSIAKMMQPNMPSSEHIMATINYFVDKYIPMFPYNDTSELRNLALQCMCKYLDEMLCVYSSESLSKEMKHKYKMIEKQVSSLGKTMDDVRYAIPSYGKSFDLITYQFAQVNNIPADRIVSFCDDKEEDKIDNAGKVIVILDDVVGSGDTLFSQSFRYGNVKKYDNLNIIFAPLTSTKTGKDLFDFYNDSIQRVGKDFYLPSKMVDYKNFYSNKLSDEEQSTIVDLHLFGTLGYGQGTACTAMPYMIPDNDSELAAQVLLPVLKNSFGSKIYLSKTDIDKIKESEFKLLSQSSSPDNQTN